MEKTVFGSGKREITRIGLGTWQLGTKWGDPFNETEAMKILEAAYETGITFIDTADVYNDGNSEKAIGKLLRKYPDHFYVVTKCGRALNPHTDEMYTPDAIEGFVDGSLSRMGAEKLDNILLHCPPSSVFRKDEIFTRLDKMKKSGKLLDYGVSIEKVSEGLDAMEYDISAIEVIYNMFRMKPEEELFPRAKEKGVGIIARVPLASGLLTGRYTKDTVFGEKDHRTYNRDGAAFDKGETFSGVGFELGLEAADKLKELFGTQDLIPYALRWVLMQEAVSVVIPGASRVEQVYSNVKAAQTDALTDKQMEGVREIYDKYIRPSVHGNW